MKNYQFTLLIGLLCFLSSLTIDSITGFILAIVGGGMIGYGAGGWVSDKDK